MENQDKLLLINELLDLGFKNIESNSQHYYNKVLSTFIEYAPFFYKKNDYVKFPNNADILQWLREEKGLFCNIIYYSNSLYYFEILDFKGIQINEIDIEYETYLETENECIKYCLQYLKNKVFED
jgi:hypothetical protein